MLVKWYPGGKKQADKGVVKQIRAKMALLDNPTIRWNTVRVLWNTPHLQVSSQSADVYVLYLYFIYDKLIVRYSCIRYFAPKPPSQIYVAKHINPETVGSENKKITSHAI